jgi:hypothetical protein
MAAAIALLLAATGTVLHLQLLQAAVHPTPMRPRQLHPQASLRNSATMTANCRSKRVFDPILKEGGSYYAF